jgi:hypothetical protein
MNPKIISVSIRDYAGCAFRTFEVGPSGVEIYGPCGVGKSSIGDAITAALAAKGVDPSCVRRGADRSEILIHCADFDVRRVVPREGRTTLTVRNNAGDTRPWASPREKVDEIFGAMVDPIAFVRETDPKKRLALLCGAIKMELTAEQLEEWTAGDRWDPEPGTHPLVRIDEIRQHYYGKRTEANKAAKSAKARLADAEEEARKLASPEHEGIVVPAAGVEEDPLRAAQRELDALEQQAITAQQQAKRMESTRSRIMELRGEAKAIGDTTPAVPEAEFEEAQRLWSDQCHLVEELRTALIEAERVRDARRATLDDVAKRKLGRREAIAKAEGLRDQAGQLEATLASTAVEAPSEAVLESARQRIADEQRQLGLVRAARTALEATARAAELAVDMKDAQEVARALDEIVGRLTTDAPAELVAKANAIPGLSIQEGRIVLDGVDYDGLAGSEKLRFAVSLAKRVSPIGKFMKVDEVGSLDEKTRAEFYEMATADGWQLCAIRPYFDPDQPTDEPVIEPIEKATEKLKVEHVGGWHDEYPGEEP